MPTNSTGSSVPPNQYEQQARDAKVKALTDRIVEYNRTAARPLTAEVAALLSADEWEQVAGAMGIRRPGKRTRVMVVQNIARKEKGQ